MNAITFEIGLMSLVRSSNFDENFKITRLDDKTLKALVQKKQHIILSATFIGVIKNKFIFYLF